MPLQVPISASVRHQSTTDEIARMNRGRRLKLPSRDRLSDASNRRRTSGSSQPYSQSPRNSARSDDTSSEHSSTITQLLDGILPAMRDITGRLDTVEKAYKLQLPPSTNGQLSIKSKLNLADIKAFNQWDKLEYDPPLQHKMFLERFNIQSFEAVEASINAIRGTQTGFSEKMVSSLLQLAAKTAVLSQRISDDISDSSQHPAFRYGSVKGNKLVMLEQGL